MIRLAGSVQSTLARRDSQLHLYLEAARRPNFAGMVGRARSFVSASAEVLAGSCVTDLTTTQRWTTDRTLPSHKDRLYTVTLGYNFASLSLVSLSVARERVGDRAEGYGGVRLTQTITIGSRRQTSGQAYRRIAFRVPRRTRKPDRPANDINVRRRRPGSGRDHARLRWGSQSGGLRATAKRLKRGTYRSSAFVKNIGWVRQPRRPSKRTGG